MSKISNMKKTASFLLIAVAALAISFTACKSKPKDADIKTSVEKILAADEMSKGTTVAVDKGVVTITGECKDDMCKQHCGQMVTDAKIKGVKEVVNNCTVAPPVVPTVTDAGADALSKAVADAVKDFPGVNASVKDQVVTLTGEIVGKEKLQKLMMAINALKAVGMKKIESSGLIRK
jgi:hyperosmotically inducible periplasmic protein